MQITKPLFDETEIDNLKACLDSGWVTQGPFTQKFEKQICEAQDIPYGLAVTSCTAALHLAILALGIGPGDEVIVPAFTWITSANAIEYAGAKAVFVDVNPVTFNIDPAEVEKAITPNTKAIMVVHLFGLSAAMDELLTITKDKGIFIVEDAACALGTTYRNNMVGTIGDIGCFSFHPRKVITTGEGGFLSTNQDILYKRLAALRNHGADGMSSPTDTEPMPWTMANFPVLGFNYRMSDIQAAVGCAQIKKFEFLLQERRNCAKRYDELLKNLNGIIIPYDSDETGGHSYQSYVIRVASEDREQRNSIMTLLANHNIQTRPGTHAVHRLSYYANKYGLCESDFPNSTLCEDTSITLPIFTGMTEKNQEEVVSHISKLM